MSAKHTPGPWFVGLGKVKQLDGEYLAVGLLARDPGAVWEPIGLVSPSELATETYAANARLIAAAPEQHELLATFTDWARQVAGREDVPRGIRSAAAQLADDGRRLIAKATGEAA